MKDQLFVFLSSYSVHSNSKDTNSCDVQISGVMRENAHMPTAGPRACEIRRGGGRGEKIPLAPLE